MIPIFVSVRASLIMDVIEHWLILDCFYSTTRSPSALAI